MAKIYKPHLPFTVIAGVPHPSLDPQAERLWIDLFETYMLCCEWQTTMEIATAHRGFRPICLDSEMALSSISYIKGM